MWVRSIALIFFVALCCLPTVLVAQLSFSTIADKQQVALNEVIQVQFIAENASEIEDFTAPVFANFTVLQGPIETNGMSIVNGAISKYRALTFILRPNKKGVLTLSGATAVINGKKMTSNVLRIEVSDARKQPTNPYPIDPGISGMRRQIQDEYLLKPGENAVEKIKSNLLVVLDLDKTQAYIGEPIVANYKLLTRLRSDSRVSKRPSMNGFSVYDMVEPDGLGPTIEERNGKEFQAHIIRKTQLFPLQEGKFELEPIELNNKVRFLRSNAAAGGNNRSEMQQLMDELMNEETGSWEEHEVTVASAARTITILPLPEGAPAGFSGAVGKFTATGRADRLKLAAGESFTYTLELNGAGNLPLINAPEWKLPDTLTLYEPTARETLNKQVSPMEGTKSFTYTITPTGEGDFDLPGISFSYFDPATKSYHQLETDSFHLRVTPSPIRKKIKQPDGIEVPLISPGSWLVIGIGLLGFIGLIAILFKKKKELPEPVVQQLNAAAEQTTVALTAIVQRPDIFLQPAAAALEQPDPKVFYRSLDLGIWNYFNQALQLNNTQKQKETVALLLSNRAIADELVNDLLRVWKRCEWALYAPSVELDDRGQLLDTTLTITRRIHEELAYTA